MAAIRGGGVECVLKAYTFKELHFTQTASLFLGDIGANMQRNTPITSIPQSLSSELSLTVTAGTFPVIISGLQRPWSDGNISLEFGSGFILSSVDAVSSVVVLSPLFVDGNSFQASENVLLGTFGVSSSTLGQSHPPGIPPAAENWELSELIKLRSLDMSEQDEEQEANINESILHPSLLDDMDSHAAISWPRTLAELFLGLSLQHGPGEDEELPPDVSPLSSAFLQHQQAPHVAQAAEIVTARNSASHVPRITLAAEVALAAEV
ncbi:hypothetical protein HDU67_009589 [Dinochytrium kinnereticum]|nr:hypothetical protein HDU67_009589 [Dinochytrium kinnereticum]